MLVDDNRITTVARGQGQISAESAAEIIDGGGMTLMPGMVEGHCHLSFVGPARNQDLGEIPPEEHLLRTCRNATLILNHGFTSCYSAASAKLRLDVVVRQEIEDGYLAGPRYRAAGPEITVTGGLGDERKQHMHAESFGMIADGPDEIRRAVRLCCREGVDNVKINISGDEFVSNARAEITSMSEIEVATAVEVAHEWNKRVACHARAAASVKRAVRNRCRLHLPLRFRRRRSARHARGGEGPRHRRSRLRPRPQCGLRRRRGRHDARGRREHAPAAQARGDLPHL